MGEMYRSTHVPASNDMPPVHNGASFTATAMVCVALSAAAQATISSLLPRKPFLSPRLETSLPFLHCFLSAARVALFFRPSGCFNIRWVTKTGGVTGLRLPCAPFGLASTKQRSHPLARSPLAIAPPCLLRYHHHRRCRGTVPRRSERRAVLHSDHMARAPCLYFSRAPFVCTMRLRMRRRLPCSCTLHDCLHHASGHADDTRLCWRLVVFQG